MKPSPSRTRRSRPRGVTVVLLFIAGAGIALALKVSDVIGEDPRGKTYVQVIAKLNPTPAKPRYANTQRDERATSPDSVGKVLNDPEIPTSGPGPIMLVVGRMPTAEDSPATTGRPGPVANASVPNVVGFSKDEASRRIYRVGLVPVLEEESTTDQRKVGKVIRTSPPAGGSAARNSRVTVFIGKAAPAGAKLVKVCNVDGMGLEEAEALLEGQGLTVRLEPKPTKDKSQDGQVESQDPPEGTEVAAGREVTLVCWTYTPAGAGEMPKVTGMTVRQARQGIAEAAKGFHPRVRLEKDTDPYRRDEDRGTVVRQQPEPGKKLAEGTEVVLWYVPKKGLGLLGPIIGAVLLALAVVTLLVKRPVPRSGSKPQASTAAAEEPAREAETDNRTLQDLWSELGSMGRGLHAFDSQVKKLAESVGALCQSAILRPVTPQLRLPSLLQMPVDEDLAGAWDYMTALKHALQDAGNVALGLRGRADDAQSRNPQRVTPPAFTSPVVPEFPVHGDLAAAWKSAESLTRAMGEVNRVIVDLDRFVWEVRAVVQASARPAQPPVEQKPPTPVPPQPAGDSSRTQSREQEIEARLKALEERLGGPTPASRGVPPEQLYNDALANQLKEREFRRAFQPRVVCVTQLGGAVSLRDGRTGVVWIVNHNGAWFALPAFAVDAFQVPTLKLVFDVENDVHGQRGSGFVRRVVAPAVCEPTEDGWMLRERGRIVV